VTRRASWTLKRASGIAAAAVLVTASPASAHGIGGRSDLPVPVWLFSYAAGAAVVASFIALRFLWPRPRLMALAEGRSGPGIVDPLSVAALVVCRMIGGAALTLVIVAAWFGSDDASSNIAPVALYIVFWIGLQFASVLFGNVWQLFNPLDTISRVVERLRRSADSDGTRSAGEGHVGRWAAAPMLLSFVWLELAYYDASSPNAIATWLTIYVGLALVGASVWGRGWLQDGEGFGTLFSLLALLSPIFVEDGRVRFRLPFSGLATATIHSGHGALIAVVLGSTTFDGFSRTEFWSDIVGNRTGWARTQVATLGLLVVIVVMALVYVGASWLMGRFVRAETGDLTIAFMHSLIPILFAYTMAHYFSLFVFEGQSATALLSDPLGRGWDLFGTASNRIDYTTVSVNTIAYVQVGTIVVGHVAGVVVAHDRSVERFSRKLAEVSQYPLLAVMVLYTIGGLGLLLGY
jgi:hypothetical protein